MPNTLKQEIYTMVHQGRHSPEQLADHLGISVHYLYKISNPTENRYFPAELLESAMKYQGYYGPLDHIALRCRRLTVSVRQVAANKDEDSDILSNYQESCLMAQHALQAYMKNRNDREAAEEAQKRLTDNAEHSIGLAKRIDKDGQIGLFYE